MNRPAICKSCGEAGHWQSFCWRKAKTVPKAKKRPSPIGKKGLAYIEWRDTVAKPYLDKKFGHRCYRKWCRATGDLDVGHILGRGSNPKLRMELTNVRWVCRKHHIEEHNGTHS